MPHTAHCLPFSTSFSAPAHHQMTAVLSRHLHHPPRHNSHPLPYHSLSSLRALSSLTSSLTHNSPRTLRDPEYRGMTLSCSPPLRGPTSLVSALPFPLPLPLSGANRATSACNAMPPTVCLGACRRRATLTPMVFACREHLTTTASRCDPPRASYTRSMFAGS